MTPALDYISFSPYFFARFKSDMIVFGYEGLPEKLHLTIVGPANSKDVNLHLTNENGALKKPRVTVGIADQAILHHKTEALGIDWLYDQLDPIRLRRRPKRKRLGYRDRAYYIRLDNLDSNPSFDVVRKNLIQLFWDNVKIERKTKIKIQPTILPALQAWTMSPTAVEFFFQNLKPAFKHPFSAAEFGYWYSSEYSGVVLIVEGYLYKPKENWSVFDFLATFPEELKISSFITKYKSAIPIVAAATEYEDTQPFDNPLRIC